MLKIYHNSRCSKSRLGLEYLKTKNLEFEIIEYLNKPLSFEELEQLLVKLDKQPSEMIRTQEEYYKKELKGEIFSDHELIKIMVENPKLIKRPIVETTTKAIWAVPAENIDELSL
ncbi:MAG: hypothetical protein JEZ03_00830 [Bacteroidales bacterium]|nr:hypothetical protein [Bacteroidales bacterium]